MMFWELGPAFLALVADRYFFDIGGHLPTFEQLGFWLRLFALVGLPVAVLICFVSGAPMLDRAVAQGRTRWIDAVVAGSKMGLILGCISLAFTALQGFVTLLDNNSSFNSWWLGRQTVEDGMLTAFGWALELGEFLTTVVTGALAGLVAWWAGGFRHLQTPRPTIHEMNVRTKETVSQ